MSKGKTSHSNSSNSVENQNVLNKEVKEISTVLIDEKLLNQEEVLSSEQETENKSEMVEEAVNESKEVESLYVDKKKEEVEEPKVEEKHVKESSPVIKKESGVVILITVDGCIVKDSSGQNQRLYGYSYKKYSVGDTIEF